MKHLIATLVLLLLFTACGTVRTKPTYLGSEITLEKKEQKKSVVIRPFLYHDFEFQKLMTTWRHDPKFEQAVLKAFKGASSSLKFRTSFFRSRFQYSNA